MKGFKSNGHANGHITVGGLFNQRSYDCWKGGSDWRGNRGGGGGGGKGGLGPWAGP